MTPRTPAEKYEQLRRGACPECDNEELRTDDDGIEYCPKCDWSVD